MTAPMDIERIKKTALGRAWLAVFVRRVWESLDDHQRSLFRLAVAQRDIDGERLIVLHPTPSHENRVRAMAGPLVGGWVVGDQVGYWLTPLGVEVYLYGRRLARGGAPESQRQG